MDIQYEIETIEASMISGLISDKEYDDALNALIKDGNRINHWSDNDDYEPTNTIWS